MIKGGPNEPRKSNQEITKEKICRKDGRAGAGSRENRPGRGLQARKHRTSATLPLEAEVYPKRRCGSSRNQARSKTQGRSQAHRTQNGNRATVSGTARDFDRAASHEKKESLSLEGPLYGRHLTKAQREGLIAFIAEANASRSIEAICDALELHPRAYYRWKAGALSSSHGGGGGKNQITPLE